MSSQSGELAARAIDMGEPRRYQANASDWQDADRSTMAALNPRGRSSVLVFPDPGTEGVIPMGKAASGRECLFERTADKPIDRLDLVGVTQWTAAYDNTYDRYQTYYATGLRGALTERGVTMDAQPLHRMTHALQLLRRVRNSYKLSGLMRQAGWILDSVAGAVAGRRMPPSGMFNPIVGQYQFSFTDGQTIRLAVDAHDSGHIADDGLLHGCDVYAKSNFRLDQAYPPHVVPIVNGNPVVPQHLPVLRGLRGRDTEYDLCFVVRVWGGKDEEAGVEHNLRLLEALNKVRARKFLLAYLVTGDVAAQERRLQSQGIPTTRTPMPLRKLWDVASVSRLNVIRLGMHNCIPWRFTDMLAMGACMVLDQAPQTIWPTPLLPGEHFYDLGANTPPAGGVASDDAYDLIPEHIDRLLADPEAFGCVRKAAADYYDRDASPTALGHCLLNYIACARNAFQSISA